MTEKYKARVYRGENLPPMFVAPPKHKAQTAKQRGVQPDRTMASQNQWFTKPGAAKLCLDILKAQMARMQKKFDEYIIVEPSAGDGKFYELLPNGKRIGVDLAPQIPGVEQGDFLNWRPRKNGKYAVVGNPPFGVRGNLADAFIKRAAMFADVCAFILPISFRCPQKSYYPGFDLIHSEELPPDIFVNIDGRESNPAGQGAINTVFNVWAAGDSPPPPKIDYVCKEYIRVAACNYPAPSRRFVENSDVFVKARFYGKTKISENFDEVRSRNSYYVVGIGADRNKKRIVNALKGVDWLDYATKAMNGSYSITLANTRRALADIGLARKVVKGEGELL